MKQIDSFTVTTDVPIQMRAKVEAFSHGGKTFFVLVNFDHNTCQIGYMESWDGVNSTWQTQNTFAIRESKDCGIQYFNGCGWSSFEESVQIAYSQYLIEKELKNET